MDRAFFRVHPEMIVECSERNLPIIEEEGRKKRHIRTGIEML